MHTLKLLVYSVTLAASASLAAAEESRVSIKVQAALKTAFPDEAFSIWNAEAGDVNGDEIEDLSLILTRPDDPGPRKERLAILAGHLDGSYSMLAVSNQFCNARQFYNLSIKGKSLLVTGYSSASSHFNLQFRYNDKRKKLELIGEDEVSENEMEKSSYRMSINHLTKKISYSRRKGNRNKEETVYMKSPDLISLQGFDCTTYREKDKERNFYIDEDFVFRRR